MLIAAWWVVRGARPVRLVEAGAAPQEAVERGGTWYWLERPDHGRARLVRASGGSVALIATADAIAGFDVQADNVAWTQRDGPQWSVMAGPAGGAKRTVWSGTAPAGRPCFASNRIIWTVQQPGMVRTSVPVPALAPTVQVLAADSGGRPLPIAALPEADARALGAHNGHVFIDANPSFPSASMAFYDVPCVGGGAPHRIAGQIGSYPALLREDGTVVWASASQDSSNYGTVSCVRAIGPGASAPTTLGDWLPSGGQLFMAGRDIYYVGGYNPVTLWMVTNNQELPRAVRLPAGYEPLAIGDRDVLLRRIGDPAGRLTLYVLPRP